MSRMVPSSFQDYGWRDWFHDYYKHPRHLLYQNFGLGGLIHNDFIHNLTSPSILHDYYYPRHDITERTSGRGESKIQQDKDKFQVTMDVHNFGPHEITVKTADNNTIIVEGKHEEKKGKDGSHVSRQFSRRYDVPSGHDMDNVQSSLSSDGMLTVTAPKLTLLAPGEKIIHINYIATPAVKNA